MVRTPSRKLRELFGLSSFEHESQLNQDIFALLMNGFEPGFFVEIGANDGTTLSNTVYLEECYGWQGILIEANPKYRSSLARRKRSKIVIKAVFSSKERMEFVDAGLYGGMSQMLDGSHQQYTNGCGRIHVECEPLIDILKSCNAPDRIDFISVDVEGMESAIVEQIANSPYRFNFGCVEHNFRPDKYPKMASTLRSANYRILWEGQTRQDMFFIDGDRNPGNCVS
jgi:FkbM family methyltransferase